MVRGPIADGTASQQPGTECNSDTELSLLLGRAPLWPSRSVTWPVTCKPDPHAFLHIDDLFGSC